MSNRQRFFIFCTFLLGPSTLPGQDQLTIIPIPKAEQKPHQVGEKFGGFSVEVRDEKSRPVPGATLVFTVSPGNEGAYAYFETNKPDDVQMTDADGIARSKKLRANGTAGQFAIHIHARFDGKEGAYVIHDGNASAPLVTRKRALIAGAAAAAVLIPLLALRSTPPPKATISTVTPTGPIMHP